METAEAGSCWGCPPIMCGRPGPALQRARVLSIPDPGSPLGTGPWGQVLGDILVPPAPHAPHCQG